MQKNILLTGCSILLFLVCVSCRRTDIKTVVVSVPEMRNRVCAEIVLNSLRGQFGVMGGSDIQVDLENQTVTVQYESLFTAKKNIEYAIAASGFTANGIPGDKEAAKKLPESCFVRNP